MDRIQRRRQREVRQELYALERKYGLTDCTYVQVSRSTTDLDTGEQTGVETHIDLQRVITYSVSVSDFVSANVKTNYSARVEIGDRIFIVRRVFDFGPHDYFIYRGERFRIKSKVIDDVDAAFEAVTEHLPNDKPTPVVTLNLNSLINLS